MPYIKFDTPKGKFTNKGSCKLFVEYLLKEDEILKNDKEYFFNQKNDMINQFEVIQSIDSNRQGLKKTEAKFYTGSINFSEDELLFIGNDYEKIKDYTIEVFKLYAKNFNKNLSINDINWFAKIEKNRYYKGTDPEVKSGEKRQGDIKPGRNTHVHFIAGRKSVDGKRKLSPVTNHKETTKGAVKGGFCRDKYKKDAELFFDSHFYYNRDFLSKYSFVNEVKKHNTNTQILKTMIENNRIQFDKLNKQDKLKKLNSFINYLNKELEKKGSIELNKKDLLQFTEKNSSSVLYRSLINLNFRINDGETLPKDLNRFVLEYAKFANQPYNSLPISLKKDKLERYVHMINRRLPDGVQKLESKKVLDIEELNNYSGKSYKILNEIHSLLKEKKLEELKNKIDNLNNQSNISERKQKLDIDLDKKSFGEKLLNEVANKVMPMPTISNILSSGTTNNEVQSEEEKEEEKNKQKRRKKRRNNQSRN